MCTLTCDQVHGEPYGDIIGNVRQGEIALELETLFGFNERKIRKMCRD